MKSFPERMCVVCRGKGGKSTLLRLVWSADKVVVDRNHSLPGRGAYLHRSWDCWSKLGNASRWTRALRLEGKCDLSPSLQDVFREIRDMLGFDPDSSTGRGRASGSKKI